MTANIAASIRGRLRNKARPDGTDFQTAACPLRLRALPLPLGRIGGAVHP